MIPDMILSMWLGAQLSPAIACADAAFFVAQGCRQVMRHATSVQTHIRLPHSAPPLAEGGVGAMQPWMGLRARLRAGFDCGALSTPEARVICAGMKKYGLILADAGRPWFMQVWRRGRQKGGCLECAMLAGPSLLWPAQPCP